MRKLRQLLPVFILALGLMSLYGCKKKEKEDAATGTGKPFYCKLDGADFAPSGGGRYYTISGGPTIQIVGDDPTNTLELRVTNSTVGTYALTGSGAGNNYASVYYSAGGKEYVSTSGEVKITKADGSKMSGTFHYSATGPAGTVEVTAGEFNDIPKK